MKSDSMAGKIALVTGAAAGLGAQFAACLARDGADVILVDLHGGAAKSVAAELTNNYGVKTHVIEQDLCDPVAATNIFEACGMIGWRVDFLVNNAGSLLNRPMHLMPWAEVRRNIQLLLRSPVELCHRFLPAMIKRGWGRIINVSSVSGFMPGTARLATYNASKAFLIPFSEAIGLELAGTGVNVTVVCPGFMKTNIFTSSGIEDVAATMPSFMWQDPAQVAKEAVHAVCRGRPVRVSGLPNRLIVTVARFVPRSILRERARILDAVWYRVRPTAEKRPVDARKPVALVTGASSGIGASLSEEFARHGYDVAMVARRADVLERRANELSSRYSIRAYAIVQDLEETNAAERIDVECSRLGLSVDILVNNAARPVTEVFHKMKWQDIADALNILIGAPVELTHRFVPGMVARGSGRIVNVASMAAFQPGTYCSGTYTASKAFLLGFSESVGTDLKGSGVFVTAICPGFTRTEWSSNTNVASEGIPNLLWMESDEVAVAAFQAVRHGAMVSVIGTLSLRAMYMLFRMMPRHLLGTILSRKRRSMEISKRG